MGVSIWLAASAFRYTEDHLLIDCSTTLYSCPVLWLTRQRVSHYIDMADDHHFHS
jgi:hypothetical protein